MAVNRLAIVRRPRGHAVTRQAGARKNRETPETMPPAFLSSRGSLVVPRGVGGEGPTTLTTRQLICMPCAAGSMKAAWINTAVKINVQHSSNQHAPGQTAGHLRGQGLEQFPGGLRAGPQSGTAPAGRRSRSVYLSNLNKLDWRVCT